MSLNQKAYGTDLFGGAIKPDYGGIVAEKFIVPPFSILNTRSGFWQERKRKWISLGIKSEVGRGDDLTFTGAARSFDHYRVKEGKRGKTDIQGTSVFDPVLTELMYQWFCPQFGQVIDPFAGGSVRGVVAPVMGYKYWGSELRSVQVDSNQQQSSEIGLEQKPHWVVGDSLNTLDKAPDADLEKYSDDPRDLSNMEYHTFLAAYRRIILKSSLRLKKNRFACFVVGDFRDKGGWYRNFIGDTVSSFLQCKMKLYNEAILVNVVGSGSMRAIKQFDSGRKMIKTHQNVLVFAKGDPKIATQEILKSAA